MTWLPELPLKSVSYKESELPPPEAEQDWAPCPENAQKEVTATEGLLRAEPVFQLPSIPGEGTGGVVPVCGWPRESSAFYQ